MDSTLARDVAAVAKIDAVPTLLEVVCRTTGLGFAAIARVTEHRWIACAVRDEIAFGLEPGGELEVATTICDEIRDSGKLVVIEDVASDGVYCNHPTPKRYGFRSYISVPIYRSGQFFGTLCAIDPRPARLRKIETIGMFTLFANLIGFYLDSQEQLATSASALLNERQTATLREQFIAVLGHDLRNPLASIDATAKALRMMQISETTSGLALRIERSAARMAGLIDNMLDFARGRLGGGLELDKLGDARLEPVLEHVVAELQSAWPDRVIRLDTAMNGPVPCDSARIGQLLSNLLGNALTHGDPVAPVRVDARSDEKEFSLSVVNRGEVIPPDTIDRLFQPFWRGRSDSRKEGLGLGLFIASEIARAHQGALAVASSPDETRFTFRMPLD